MKKTLIALAALGAFAGAHAQSTVTIYGLLDANFGSYKTNNISGAVGSQSVQSLTQTKVDSGGLNGSRWGIRVSEDLGGGLAAIGNLESGFNIDAGSSAQGGLLFGRRANVGLTSASAGTVTIGRNSSSFDDVSADGAMMAETLFDPSLTNNGVSASAVAGSSITTLAGAAQLLSHGGATGTGAQVTWVGYNTRFNNSIKYISPTFSGFSGSAMYAFGEDKTVAQSASKATSLYLKYANGPLLVSGAFQSEGGALNQTTGAKPVLQNTLLSVAYDLGVAKLGVGFNRAQYKAVTATGGDLAAQKEFNLSVAVPVGAATLSAGYAQSKGDDLGKSTGFGAQALYSLSKRTTLYAGGVSTKGYSNLVAAAQALAPTSNISRATTYGIGVRHTF